MKKQAIYYSTFYYRWVKKNLEKFIILIVIHFLITYILNLPYINLIKILFSFLPYVVDWAVVLILFQPKREFMLKGAVALLVISFIPGLFGFQLVPEFLGNIVFMLIVTYILYSLPEIRK